MNAVTNAPIGSSSKRESKIAKLRKAIDTVVEFHKELDSLLSEIEEAPQPENKVEFHLPTSLAGLLDEGSGILIREVDEMRVVLVRIRELLF